MGATDVRGVGIAGIATEALGVGFTAGAATDALGVGFTAVLATDALGVGFTAGVADRKSTRLNSSHWE